MGDLVFNRVVQGVDIEGRVTVVPGTCPVSSDPGEGNVLTGVDYMIDDVPKTGTFVPPPTPSGIYYRQFDLVEGIGVSGFLYDTDYMRANGELTRVQPVSPALIVESDHTVLMPWFWLKDANIFGNKSRFTNTDGEYWGASTEDYNRSSLASINNYVDGDLKLVDGTPITGLANKNVALARFYQNSNVIIDHLYGAEWIYKDYTDLVIPTTGDLHTQVLANIRAVTTEGGGWLAPPMEVLRSMEWPQWAGYLWLYAPWSTGDQVITTATTARVLPTQMFYYINYGFTTTAKTHGYGGRIFWIWRFLDSTRWLP